MYLNSDFWRCPHCWSSYCFLTKVYIGKAMVFSSSHVRMWKLDHKEGWALKNWSFQTVVWEKTFESPLHSKEIKPVNLMEISPEYSLEGLMLKLKLQYFGHLMQRADSFKTLMLGKIEGGSRRGWQRWLDGITDSMDMSLSKLRGQGILVCCSPWCCKETQLSNWATTAQFSVVAAPV